MKKSVKKVAQKTENIPLKDYKVTLKEIIHQIAQAQTEATILANKTLTSLYWNIGKIIVEKQKQHEWGVKFIEKIAQDIQNSFPGVAGFSRTNIFRMKAFYVTYSKSPTAVGQMPEAMIFAIPWGHNAVLLEKLKKNEERLWYAEKTIEYGWSRSSLETWIKSDLYRREGKAITNFSRTLPDPDSALSQQALKDPYIFDFLTLHTDHIERDLEQGLIDHVQHLLLEMGKGFALVARQYHLEIGKKDYYIDLLFYHFKLKCFVVVELKAREFDPRDAGQINFYLSAVDDLVRGPEDKPTIGLLLCKSKNNFTAEYALRDINKPIGVAEYETEIMKKLPKSLKSSLPTIEELERELEKNEQIDKPIKKAKKSK